MVGRKDMRKNMSMRIPNLETFTLLVRSVNQTSIGGTVNRATTFVTTISDSAREKLPPAIRDWKGNKSEDYIFHFCRRFSP